MIKKATKKPITIEYMRFDNGYNEVELIKEWLGESFMSHYTHDKGYIVIKTLEGYIEATEGDYIIKGVKGEFYPCKPDIFLETYDLE